MHRSEHSLDGAHRRALQLLRDTPRGVFLTAVHPPLRETLRELAEQQLAVIDPVFGCVTLSEWGHIHLEMSRTSGIPKERRPEQWEK